MITTIPKSVACSGHVLDRIYDCIELKISKSNFCEHYINEIKNKRVRFFQDKNEYRSYFFKEYKFYAIINFCEKEFAVVVSIGDDCHHKLITIFPASFYFWNKLGLLSNPTKIVIKY